MVGTSCTRILDFHLAVIVWRGCLWNETVLCENSQAFMCTVLSLVVQGAGGGGSLFPTTPGYGYAFSSLPLEPDPSHDGRREVESSLPTSVGLGL